MEEVFQKSRQLEFNWYSMRHPSLEGSCLDGMFAGLRFAIDDAGDVWAYAGLLVKESSAMMLGALSGGEFIVYRGHKYMRLDWMRQNLISDDDETGHQLASLVQARADSMKGH